MQQPVIERNSDVMGGAPVFRGTRVPVQTLLDYLEAGEFIEDFLNGFPSVAREQIMALLEQTNDPRLTAAKRCPSDVPPSVAECDEPKQRDQ